MSKIKLEDEIDFKELIKNPIRLFGWVYFLFFVVLVVMGVMYVKNLNQISYNQQPVLMTDSIWTWTDIEQKKGGISPAVDLTSITNPSSELLQKGKELYDANCQSCHGAEGKGDGTAGVALNPKPRNFQEADGWTIGRTFGNLYNTLQNGIIKNGMAAYEYIPPQDRIAIIQHLRTFAEFPEVTNDEVVNLDVEYKLSAGTEIPNQIPVLEAVNLISQETAKSVNNTKILEKLEINKTSQGYILFSKYSANSARLASSMVFNKITDYQKFVKYLQSDPVTLGFKANVLSLSENEIKQLFDFVISLQNS